MLKRENKQLIKEKKQLEKEQENLLKQLNKKTEQNIKTGIPTCHWIYKRGKKKGMRCSCKKPFPSPPMDLKNTPWYCKAHHKLVFKKYNATIALIHLNNVSENVVITV